MAAGPLLERELKKSEKLKVFKLAWTLINSGEEEILIEAYTEALLRVVTPVADEL